MDWIYINNTVMKKLMITMLLAAFCWSAYAVVGPQQDTTGRHKETKKHPMKSKMPKKKTTEKKETKKDTTNRKKADTIITSPPVM